MFVYNVAFSDVPQHTTELVGHVLSAFSATAKSKAKKAKHVPAVEPLQEGEEVTDTAGKNWKLLKLLSQSTTELLYEGEAAYRTYLLESKINVQLDR